MIRALIVTAILLSSVEAEEDPRKLEVKRVRKAAESIMGSFPSDERRGALDVRILQKVKSVLNPTSD